MFNRYLCQTVWLEQVCFFPWLKSYKNPIRKFKNRTLSQLISNQRARSVQTFRTITSRSAGGVETRGRTKVSRVLTRHSRTQPYTNQRIYYRTTQLGPSLTLPSSNNSGQVIPVVACMCVVFIVCVLH